MKKGRLSTILLIVTFLAGLSLVLYPTVSNYINSLHQTRAITSYLEKTSELNDEEYQAIIKAAENYNAELAENGTKFSLSAKDEMRYHELLNIEGNGVMGYIEISELDVALPIYHGTSNAVLQSAVGHIAWSSLPIGGESAHCVLSGHRGLPSAKLFTDLDKLREGDLFTLNILDETLTYEVDQIRVVLPAEVNDLTVVKGEDYCTLVTCTPYGINTHRLLVRGHRIENLTNGVHVFSEAIVIDPLIVAPLVALPFLLILLIMILARKSGRKKRRKLEYIEIRGALSQHDSNSTL